MSLNSKSFLPSLAILFGIIATSGCGGTSGQPSATNKPASVVEKNVEPVKAPEVVAPLPVVAEVKPGAVVPIDLGAGRPAASAKPSAEGVTLLPANWAEYVKHVVPEVGKKFTLVDAWATWCAPCKENFPHVVEMHEKYASKGLQVISLSMDDLSDSKAVKEATEFLVSKKAVFKNLIMNEAQDVAFDKLAISAIPSVFIFDSTGKEIRRFTLEDPNNQFTYAQVEATIEALLAGKPLHEFKKDSKSADKAK